MMRYCKALCLTILIMLCLAWPLAAQPVLVGLEINEEIIPGPARIYLTVTGRYADGSMRLITDGFACYSSNTIVATTSSGSVRFTGKGGNVTITVYKEGISASKSIFVQPWPEDIEIETTLVKSENPYRLMVKAELSDGSERYLGADEKVIWSTSNPWVAWVNSQGIVTFTGERGHVSIKAVVGDLSDSVSTTVTGADSDSDAFLKAIKISGNIEYSPEPVRVQLMAVMSDESETELANSSADWFSSDPEVASVNAEGEIAFTGKPGFTKIKAEYGGYKYETLVTVGRFLESISINQSLNYHQGWDGRPLPLSVTARYNDGSEYIRSSGVTWSVDNKKVAGISDNGILTFTGQGGKVTVSVKGLAYGQTFMEDSITVEVPQTDRPMPVRLSIDHNPVSGSQTLTPTVQCLYSDGSWSDVTDRVTWNVATPDTASIFQGKIYFSPNPGAIRVSARFMGLVDEISGYNHRMTGSAGRVSQLLIKQHSQAYSFRSVKLTVFAIKGDGSVQDVTNRAQWYSSQPYVAKIVKGELVFTGRSGRCVITAQGYGFRDELRLEVLPVELLPRVESLEIVGDLTKAANQLKAMAHFNDGTSKDVTGEAVWNSSNRKTALVAAGAVMFPGGVSPATITVYYRGKEATLNSS